MPYRRPGEPLTHESNWRQRCVENALKPIKWVLPGIWVTFSIWVFFSIVQSCVALNIAGQRNDLNQAKLELEHKGYRAQRCTEKLIRMDNGTFTEECPAGTHLDPGLITVASSGASYKYTYVKCVCPSSK